jgi:O-antigen/teichoic acid export membrane protein
VTQCPRGLPALAKDSTGRVNLSVYSTALAPDPSMSNAVRRGVIAMTAANAVALAAVAVSYILYSRLMTPAEFGVYAGALAIAKLGQTVLDGGLKIALVKHHEAVAPGGLRALFIGSASAGGVATLLLAGTVFAFSAAGLLAPGNALFFAAYGSAYFLTYPFLFIPLAQLERGQHFTPVAWAEMLGVTIEYGLPALLWLWVAPGFWSFILAAWVGRSLRTGLILAASSDRAWLTRAAPPKWRESKALLLEGLSLQMAVSLSLMRDSIHLLLVGPWFGKEWAGLYAWAIQMVTVASQVFVQTATRVALPALRLMHGTDARWKATLTQIAWLTIFTAPPLVFLTDIASAVNAALFDSKWTLALGLLPFMVIRMLPSMATTPLGSLVLAGRSARAYAIANAIWTAGEVVVAALMLWLYGPTGLAWSMAFMAWLGVACFVHQLAAPARFTSLLRPLLCRPSLWVALALWAAYRWAVANHDLATDLTSVCLYGAAATVLCILTERRCWQAVLPRLVHRR